MAVPERGGSSLVLPVVWREVESVRWKVEFGSRARAGRGSCCDGSRILDLILPLLSLANAWGNCWELEMEWCMFDLLEGDGNGCETWVLRCWFGGWSWSRWPRFVSSDRVFVLIAAGPLES
jgi:hypothetical protein